MKQLYGKIGTASFDISDSQIRNYDIGSVDLNGITLSDGKYTSTNKDPQIIVDNEESIRVLDVYVRYSELLKSGTCFKIYYCKGGEYSEDYTIKKKIKYGHNYFVFPEIVEEPV